MVLSGLIMFRYRFKTTILVMKLKHEVYTALCKVLDCNSWYTSAYKSLDPRGTVTTGCRLFREQSLLIHFCSWLLRNFHPDEPHPQLIALTMALSSSHNRHHPFCGLTSRPEHPAASTSDRKWPSKTAPSCIGAFLQCHPNRDGGFNGWISQ